MRMTAGCCNLLSISISLNTRFFLAGSISLYFSYIFTANYRPLFFSRPKRTLALAPHPSTSYSSTTPDYSYPLL
jgi:hypothetical protein